MRKILLIVDDWESLEWYEDRLQGDFHLTSTFFGSDGIRLARELQPDLIFLDLVLEDMTPFEAVELLQADPLTRNIPLLIVLEGGVKPIETNDLKLPEGSAFFTRPFALDDLIRCLRMPLCR